VLTFTAILALSFAVTSLALLARIRPRLVGTTLTVPWSWSVVAIVGLASLAIATAVLPDESAALLSHLRYAAGALAFLPVMAVLGASRPRDRGWPAVMVGLLVILLLPAGENWLWRPGSHLVIEGARAWFLAILIGLGLATFLATRYWMSALAVACGQAALLFDFLPSRPWTEEIAPTLSWMGPIVALACALAAILLARRMSAPVPLATADATTAQDFDRLWRDFRDSFGMLWGLRIMERMNASAKMYGWPVTLSWHGLATHAGGPPDELAPELSTQMFGVFENLLLRFVSPQWIAERKRAP
jgi:hypothetical protein